MHALFFRISHFTFGAGHVFFVAAIGTGHTARALANRGAVTVHGGITTTKHNDFLAFYANKIFRALFKAEVAIHVGNQKWQRIIDTGQVFTGEAAFHVGVGSHAHEDRVVIAQQFFHGDVLTHFGIQAEFDTHFGKDLTATAHHALFKLELRNTKSQQAADFGILIEYDRFDAVAYQYVSAANTCRASTDNRHFFVCPNHFGHIRLPPHGEGGISDVLLGVADSHCTKAIIQGTGAFTQTILRAHTTTDFRQGVGLMAEFCRFKNIAFGNQLQPVRDEVVHRALPLAVRVTTLKATVCLTLHFFFGVRLVNLHKVAFAGIYIFLGGVLTTHIEKLKIII